MSGRPLRVRHDARLVLRDRVLVACSSNLPVGLGPLVERYALASGVVGVGEAAGQAALRLRVRHPSMIVGLDPAHYLRVAATSDQPFRLPNADLYSDGSLEGYLAGLADYNVILSPSGRIETWDDKALCAVVSSSNEVDDPRWVTCLPVTAEWLSIEARRRSLIAAINSCRHLVALVVIARFDPYEEPATAEGLMELAQRCGSTIFLHRTDMAALQMLPRGISAAAIGAGASLRHTSPGFARRRKGVPPGLSVLVPGIDDFRDVTTVEDWFGDAAPMCRVENCCGRRITNFDTSNPERAALAGHNAAYWLAVVDEMLHHPPMERMAWLRRYRDRIVVAYGELRSQTRRRDIRPYGGGRVWLSLDD